jgi:hypothetical protein
MNKTVLKILLKNHFPAAAKSPYTSGFGQQREDFGVGKRSKLSVMTIVAVLFVVYFMIYCTLQKIQKKTRRLKGFAVKNEGVNES